MFTWPPSPAAQTFWAVSRSVIRPFQYAPGIFSASGWAWTCAHTEVTRVTVVMVVVGVGPGTGLRVPPRLREWQQRGKWGSWCVGETQILSGFVSEPKGLWWRWWNARGLSRALLQSFSGFCARSSVCLYTYRRNPSAWEGGQFFSFHPRHYVGTLCFSTAFHNPRVIVLRVLAERHSLPCPCASGAIPTGRNTARHTSRPSRGRTFGRMETTSR